MRFLSTSLAVLLCAGISISSLASDVKKVSPTTKEQCAKVDGFSKGLSDFIAQRLRVSKQSIYIYESFPSRNNRGCYIKIDTPKGPDSCSDTDLYTDGSGSYWVGGVCY